jgi:CHASE3 domain sensor protein
MYKHVARLFDHLPIHQKLLLISTIPLTSLILFSIVTYSNVQTFSQDEERLNNLHLTQKAAAQYMRLVDDMESGFRGYVLTEDAHDFKQYQEALEGLRGVEQDLKERLSESEQQHFKDAEALVSQCVAEMEELIRELKLGRKSIVLQRIKEGRG